MFDLYSSIHLSLRSLLISARKLLEEKRAKDEEKKKAEEREKELHRRNEGKMLTELMEKNKNRELQEMVEARQRQKKEDDMALKRLRDQIKHDKFETYSIRILINKNSEKNVLKKAKELLMNLLKLKCRMR
jgi:hypothetical protein